MNAIDKDILENLIGKGMNDAISHCQESAAALVTVAVSATDKRIDAVCQRADLLESLLMNVKELLINVDSRLGALESKTARPC